MNSELFNKRKIIIKTEWQPENADLIPLVFYYYGEMQYCIKLTHAEALSLSLQLKSALNSMEGINHGNRDT